LSESPCQQPRIPMQLETSLFSLSPYQQPKIRPFLRASDAHIMFLGTLAVSSFRFLPSDDWTKLGQQWGQQWGHQWRPGHLLASTTLGMKRFTTPRPLSHWHERVREPSYRSRTLSLLNGGLVVYHSWKCHHHLTQATRSTSPLTNSLMTK